MLDPVHEECGIAAVYRMDVCPRLRPVSAEPLDEEPNVVRLLPDMLIDLQNRGQLAAGISRYNDGDARIIDTYKDVGSVNEVFHLTYPDPSKFQSIVDRYAGRAGIGHVRYATCGKDDISYLTACIFSIINKQIFFSNSYFLI